MKRQLRTAIAATLLGVFSVGAQALPLDSLSGPYNWKLQGTTSEYSPTAYGAGALAETTWGIGQITNINQTNGDPAWASGDGGDYLYFMIYGIADLSSIGPNAGTYNLYNVGCTGGVGCDGKIHIDVYRVPAQISGILVKDPDDRTAFNAFNGVTNAPGASLYLALTLEPGKVTANDGSTAADETTTTLFQNVNTLTLPATGTGTFFADVVGGSGATKWDTNGFPVAGGALRDFDGNFTLKPNLVNAGGACPNESTSSSCFLGLINDPVQSNAIPEPGSLALVGLALTGLAGLRRRNKK